MAPDPLDSLEIIKTEMHQKFPEAIARLDQLDKHIATVAMVIRHIRDETARTQISPIS